MIIHLDMESETPIYQQLVNRIIEGIATGELVSGEDLPSVRVLASDLGINLHTVNKAYQQLKQEGYIQIHRQKGVIVLPQEARMMDLDYQLKIEQELRLLVAKASCKGMSEEDFLNLCNDQFLYFKQRREERK